MTLEGTQGYWVPAHVFRALAAADVELVIERELSARLRALRAIDGQRLTLASRTASAAWSLQERTGDRLASCEGDRAEADAELAKLSEAYASALYSAQWRTWVTIGGSVAATLLLVHVARNTP